MLQKFCAYAQGILASLIAPLFLFLTLAGNTAQAQTSPAIAKGVQWLNSQVQGDGSLQYESQSIATPMQNRAEAAQTLQILSTMPVALSANLNAIANNNTQYLARKIIVLSLAHVDVSSLLPILTQRQNPDGGYGGLIAYASDPINTAWAILALSQTSSSNTSAAILARSYLGNQIGIDGGVFDSTQVSRIYDNAIVLMALETTPDSSNIGSISSLTNWLQLQQSGDGSWLANTFLTAYALMAVGPVSSDNTLTGNAASYMLVKQAADGSWNEDPYLTAIVLRAISIRPLAATGATAVQGQVVDSINNTPLGGVSVTVPGNAATTITDNNGNFNLTGISAGTYTLGFATTGYSGVTRSVTVASGQGTNVGIIAMSQLGTAAVVRGQIVAAGTGTPLAGVTVSLSGATTASAVTDTSGRYIITGATPGNVAISASLAGYQTATATTTLVAGQTIAFAPGLYASGQTAPSGTQYSGTVVSAGSSTPLAGVTLQFSGAAISKATTNASGQFSVTLAPGSYSVTFSNAGYMSATQSFIAASGTTVNGGTIGLTPVQSSSTINGQVFDASSQPVAGASVQIVGTTQITTTAADGSYFLINVAGTSVSVRASATGFNSQTINLQLPQPVTLLQNFALAAQTAGGLSIGAPTVTPASVGSNANVTVATTISNSGSSVASAIVQLQIQDSTGKLIGVGAAYDIGGNIVGQLSLPAGQSANLNLVWNSAQFAPGTYSLVIRLVEVGSLVRVTPQGITLAQSAASVAVTAQSHFSGAVSANPPVLQAGLNAPVRFTATLQNDGNIPLAAQALTLSVINAADNSVALRESARSVLSPVTGTQIVTFANWTPTSGGNYNLVMAASDPSIGKLTGTLYIGDAGSAMYTTSKQIVPAGTQTVRGSVKVLGQDVASGTISDPLAPIIKAAIQKSVTYDDTTASAWSAQHQCLSCHIHTQALVGGESNRKITTFDAGQRNSILNVILSHQQDEGSFYDPTSIYPNLKNTSTALSMWALGYWHDQSATVQARIQGANYLLTQQNGDGHWDYAYPWMGQWTSATDHTALNLKSLVGLIGSLPSNPVASLNTTQFSQYLPGYNGTSGGSVIQDSAGNLYYSSLNQGAVTQIKPDGTQGLQWTGLNLPTGLVLDKSGNGVLTTTGNGLYRLTFDGQSAQVNTFTDMSYLAYGPNGTLYATSPGSGSVYTIDASGVVSKYIPSGAIAFPGFISFDASGNTIVPAITDGKIMRVNKDLSIQTLFNTNVYAPVPISAIPYGQGWLIGAQNGIFVVDSSGNLLRELSSSCSNYTTVQPNGNIVSVCYNTPGLQQVSFTQTPFDPNVASAQYSASINSATQWLLAQNLSDNIALSHQLIGLGEAAKFYASNASLHATILSKMNAIAATLRASQNSDGSWGATSSAVGDAFVTAHVGYALDYLNPSPTDPVIRNAVTWLLSVQQPDGSWNSADGIFATNVAATTWVSIWLPQALDVIGGINTDLSVTFPANVAMSNPDTVPTSVTPNSDGTSTALWHLTGVTAAGQTVNYDLTLQNMAPNEVRSVSTDAHLTFNNTFTNGTVSNPITIPQVTASAFLGLGVTTDKPSYPANTLA
ncbi:MAG TPA: carboxypeptidase-like regulatory domain-containing protein, partial [Burkholderiaceae bacterium]